LEDATVGSGPGHPARFVRRSRGSPRTPVSVRRCRQAWPHVDSPKLAWAGGPHDRGSRGLSQPQSADPELQRNFLPPWTGRLD
ncbi:unnamed protein product, partial [Ectocarpus sp. 12 AP-2014]